MAAPSTPILDDFTRANETPLSGGGNWAGPISAGDGVFNLASNAASGGTASVNNDMYFTRPFAAEQEVYLTNRTGSDIHLFLRITNPNTATWNAWEIQFFVSSNTVNIFEMVAGSNNHTAFSSTMTALGLPALASGDRYWARIWGRNNTTAITDVYADFGNVGTWVKITSTQTGSLTAALQGAGFIGALNFSNGTAFDDFGGGTILSTNYESLGRRPTPMMRGPDNDQIMRMQSSRVT